MITAVAAKDGLVLRRAFVLLYDHLVPCGSYHVDQVKMFNIYAEVIFECYSSNTQYSRETLIVWYCFISCAVSHVQQRKSRARNLVQEIS